MKWVSLLSFAVMITLGSACVAGELKPLQKSTAVQKSGAIVQKSVAQKATQKSQGVVQKAGRSVCRGCERRSSRRILGRVAFWRTR